MVIFYHYNRRWLLSKNFLVTWNTKLGHQIWIKVYRHLWFHLCHHMWLHRWRHLCIPCLYQYIDLSLNHHLPVPPYDDQHCLGSFPPPPPWYNIFIKLWLYLYWCKFNRILEFNMKFIFIWLIIIDKIISSINLCSLYIFYYFWNIHK
jgi:hypothetical protein